MSPAHLLPTEEHDGDERRFHEEGKDALDGKRRSEDVAHKPAVITPVRTELKLQDDAGRHANGEVDAEKLHTPQSPNYLLIGNKYSAVVDG